MAIVTAHDDDSLPGDLGPKVTAPLGRVLLAPNEEPLTPEPLLVFMGEDGRIMVDAARQRPRPLGGLARRLDLVGRDRSH
jgi:hypothetical protein